MFFENRQIELIKSSIKNYDFLKKQFELNTFESIEEVEEFLSRFNGITFQCTDSDYIDFEYYNLNLSINVHERPFKFCSAFEIYDNVNCEYLIEDFLTKEQWLKEINTTKEQKLNDAIVHLKYCDSHNLKVDYDRWLKKIEVFLKENW